MKTRCCLLLFSFFCTYLVGQIGHATHFPTMHVNRILDDSDVTEDLAFAYSLRLLRSDYNGPLIRLRRASDDAEEDFYWSDDDKIDNDAIDDWRGTDDVFVVTVYDQSEEGRDANQTNTIRQPQFFPDASRSYFSGDGINDILVVDDTFADLIEAGANGTILALLYSTDDRDIYIGAEGPGVGGVRDGWYSHVNWANAGVNRAYFDPGFCCGSTGNRSFINTAFSWDLYTFIRRDNPANLALDSVIGRLNGVTLLNGTIDNAIVFTATNYPMGICGYVTSSDGLSSGRHSNTRITELIMYNKGKSDAFVGEIEENQITFWGL